MIRIDGLYTVRRDEGAIGYGWAAGRSVEKSTKEDCEARMRRQEEGFRREKIMITREG